MRTILTIAWRTIWRNRRRTLISMSAVGIGLTLVIVYGGLLGGVLGQAVDQLDDSGMGHVEISAAKWRARRAVGETIASPDALIARLGLPAGAEVGWRVVGRGLITSARGSQGVELEGVDWAREARLSTHVRDVRQGALPGPGDDRGILIGDKLAARLHVAVGGKVRVMVQRADGELGVELYRVRGIFHSVAPAISQGRVLVNASAARQLLGVGDVAHQIVVQLADAADADRVAARLRATLGPAYDARSYGELMPALRTIEELAEVVVWLAALFVYSLVGLGIFNTMLMSVLERTREFGMLRAIGTRPGRVVAQVLGESFWIATLSAALGLAAGLALTWYGEHHSFVDVGGGEALEYGGAVIRSAAKTRFSPAEALKAASLVYVMALVTALYPAWKVARMPPARALHAA